MSEAGHGVKAALGRLPAGFGGLGAARLAAAAMRAVASGGGSGHRIGRGGRVEQRHIGHALHTGRRTATRAARGQSHGGHGNGKHGQNGVGAHALVTAQVEKCGR